MKKIVIEVDGVKTRRPVPQTWDELTLAQYLGVCDCILTNWGALGIFDENILPVMRQNLFYIITNTDKKFWDKVKDAHAEYAEYAEDTEIGEIFFTSQLSVVVGLTNFLFKRRSTPTGFEYEAHIRRTVCPYKVVHYEAQKHIREMTIQAAKQTLTSVKREYERSIKELKRLFKDCKEITWYAPADMLENITFYELCALFQKYEAYVTKGYKDVDLCQLIAILYRPSKAFSENNRITEYEGDRRIPYMGSESTAEARAQKAKLLHPSVKRAILCWFLGCRTALFESPRFAPLFEGEGSDDPLKLGMYKVLFALQETSPYNAQTAANENAWMALTYLAHKVLENQKE